MASQMLKTEREMQIIYMQWLYFRKRKIILHGTIANILKTNIVDAFIQMTEKY